MARLFNILFALTVVMILIAGGGSFWAAQSDVSLAKKKSIEALAQGIALGVSAQVTTLQNTVSNMAASAEVIKAVESRNSRQMAKTAATLEIILPQVLKIRILPANVSKLDESTIPHMGNADLLMAQGTLIRNQNPVIQGEGKNRHLAITAVIKKDDASIGIVLASLKYDFLQSSLIKSQLTQGFIELKQDQASLAKAGDQTDKIDSGNKIRVSQTAWNIHYWPTKALSLASLKIISGVVIFTVLMTGLIFFINYRKITKAFKQDQSSLTKVVKALMAGKKAGRYHVNLKEMKTLIATIIQYQRELGDKTPSAKSANAEIEKAPELKNQESTFKKTDSPPASSATTKQKKTDKPAVVKSAPKSSAAKGSESTIFRANDIRGIAGKTLTKEIVFDIGRAIGSEAKEKTIQTIVVGRDGRTSSPALAESLANGIVSTGVNVIDIGLVPSPVVYFVTEHTEGKSGVVITGSHNPAEYNGLKIMINGETLASDSIMKLKQRIDNEDYLTGAKGSIKQNNMFVNEYIGTISEDIHIVRPMKVVIDCGNGAAGELTPVLLKTLGCEVIELFCDIDGTFPNHHPDPGNPKNLDDLIAAVQRYQADVGIAFDGDGDRMGVIDSKGKIIWPDRQMMLFAKDVLGLKPGTEIIYDVKCSRHLGEQIVKNGGRPLMWKTGHSFMKAKLKETGASLAGEMSGHIFFNDRWFGFDDALYSASRLIEILSADTRSSAEVFSDFPDSINTPEINIELAEGENTLLMKKIMATAKFSDGKIIDIDGLRVDFEDGWGLVRASNTMPVLVLRFEADSKQALKRIQSEFKKLLTKIKPALSIPF